jgi:aminoglycoside 2'-N-acetyltransferase I
VVGTSQESGGILIFRQPGSALGESELHEWLTAAYDGDFAAEDWLHTLGGLRALIRDERGIVSHGALVPRIIVCGGRPLRAGYVEAVATRSDRSGRGHAKLILEKLGELIARDHDIGVLSTGLHDVYSSLGWERWRGASYVQKLGERVRTAEDDACLMVLRTSRTRDVDLNGDIVADWRDGDIW